MVMVVSDGLFSFFCIKDVYISCLHMSWNNAFVFQHFRCSPNVLHTVGC